MEFKTLTFTTEAFNKPYTYRWLEKHSNYGEYTIAFYEYDFGKPENFGITSKGDAFRVMATVMKVIDEFVKKYYKDITILHFSAEKPTKGKYKEVSSREKLYNRMFKKYMPYGDWTRWKKNDNSGSEYQYIKTSEIPK